MTSPPTDPAPAETASDLDVVFRALADPSRRQLLDRLNDQSGQTLRELCAGLDMARQSVSKHLAVLEEARLVVTVRHGREKLHYLNAAPISEIAERWINRYDQPRVDALSNLKRALEDSTMAQRPAFVYTTYINTTPEQLWTALTEPAFTKTYWGLTLESTWEVGAQITWQHQGVTIAHPDQVVLAYEPYRRLSYTWHTFTPEWAEAFDVDDERRDALAGERRSKATFELEPVDSTVKLTVIHDDFEDDSLVAEMVSTGWPRVVSALKTFLEAPEALSAPAARDLDSSRGRR